jgi:hypothetical protein
MKEKNPRVRSCGDIQIYAEQACVLSLIMMLCNDEANLGEIRCPKQ